MTFFFKKLVPATPVTVPGLGKFQFTSIDGNLTGYFATDNEQVAGAFKQAIAEQRYGLTEISQAEFHADYVEPKKKGRALPISWRREEMGSAGLQESNNPINLLGPEKVAAAVGFKVPLPRGSDFTLEENPPAATAPAGKPSQQEVAPTVGKRPRRQVEL